MVTPMDIWPVLFRVAEVTAFWVIGTGIWAHFFINLKRKE